VLCFFGPFYFQHLNDIFWHVKIKISEESIFLSRKNATKCLKLAAEASYIG